MKHLSSASIYRSHFFYFFHYSISFYNRANFPGGALNYNEYYTQVTKQISGLPG